MTKNYGKIMTDAVYRGGICPVCKAEATRGDLSNDDGINFWEVLDCTGCGAEITVAMKLISVAAVAVLPSNRGGA